MLHLSTLRAQNETQNLILSQSYHFTETDVAWM